MKTNGQPMTESESIAVDRLVIWGAPPSTQMTQPLFRFYSEHRQFISFFMFVNDLAKRADNARTVAAQALIKGAPPESLEARELQKTLDEPDFVFNRLKEFRQIQSRNLLVSAVNNFLCYFSEIISIAIIKRPELLRSGSMIKTEDVLTFRRRSDLISHLVDRQVNELSYGGILKMESYMQDRLGIDPFPDEPSKLLMILAMEIRNVHTHNRGYVNELFLSRLKDNPTQLYKTGEYAYVDFDMFRDFASNMFTVVDRIDRELGLKFRIGRKRYATWSNGARSQVE